MRRWFLRLGLAIVIAVAIGYVPAQMFRRDPRALKLEAELDQLDVEARELAAGNAALRQDIAALQQDVAAIETLARSDLGMVYPDEIILKVAPP